jgi:hypothetical protein
MAAESTPEAAKCKCDEEDMLFTLVGELGGDGVTAAFNGNCSIRNFIRDARLDVTLTQAHIGFLSLAPSSTI